MTPALLLVDLQRDYLNSRGLQPSADLIVARAAALVAGCRQRRIPIIHLWTTIDRADDRRLPHWKRDGRWLCVAGTEGHRTASALQPMTGEIVAHKRGFNGFADPGLEAALRRLGCDAVILAGVHLHTCVRAAATESMERGLEVFVADDATGSNDPLHAAAVRRWLVDRYVRFEPVAALLARLDGGGASTLVHRSPSDSARVLFEVPVAGPDAVAAAAEAVESASLRWQQTELSSRRQLLADFAQRLDDAAPALSRQMAVELGKPLSHGLEEVARAAACIRDVVARAASFASWTREAAGVLHHRPLGVVALISPWNEPVAIPLGKIAPALLYGNGVVWKPAPAATKIAQTVVELLYRAGDTTGAVALVTGDHTTAQRLASDERVDAVAFTGAARGGYAMQEICARRGIPLQAELGGNNASIVWDDVDLARAAGEIVRGAFAFAGQRCTANRRVVVSRSRSEALMRELARAAEELVWGDPADPRTDLGPVIDAARRDEHARLVDAAEGAGTLHRVVRLFEAQARASWVKAGAFAQPVIAFCDSADSAIVQEETMSPLLVVQRADDFDHALRLCNDVRHGLVASLFSKASDLQQAFFAGARAGVLKLNASTAGVDRSLAFGEWTAFGTGLAGLGEGDRLLYTRTQSVYGAAAQGEEAA